jgi:proteic killer suppression protein
MKIRNVIHKGLRRLIEHGDGSALPAAVVPKIVRIVSFLQDMTQEDELLQVPTWRAHRMTGDRRGAWSLSVTRNWRITFRIDEYEIEIVDLDYQDYH